VYVWAVDRGFILEDYDQRSCIGDECTPEEHNAIGASAQDWVLSSLTRIDSRAAKPGKVGSPSTIYASLPRSSPVNTAKPESLTMHFCSFVLTQDCSPMGHTTCRPSDRAVPTSLPLLLGCAHSQRSISCLPATAFRRLQFVTL
jgi:hypothetical protein